MSKKWRALGIVLIYILVAGIYIMLSDQWLAGISGEPSAATALQTVKGWAYVLATAAAFYVLLERAFRAVRRSQRAEESLRESTQTLQALFEASPLAIVTLDRQACVTLWNPAAERIFGWRTDEALGQPPRFVPRESRAEFEALYAQVMAGESHVERELRRVRKDGTPVDVSLSTSPLRDAKGAIVSVMAVIADIGMRKRADEALRRSEEEHRLLFDNMLDGFAVHRIVTDQDGKPVDYVFLDANQAFERLTGLRRTAIVGRKVTEVLPGIESDPADWIGKYGRVALAGERLNAELYSQPLGRWYSVSAYCPQPGYFATVFQDTTERRQAEEQRQALEAQLRQAQKMEGMGLLAGSVAHDFNNLLTVILGNTELAMAQLTEQAGPRAELARARGAAMRGATLARQLLAFARRRASQSQRLDLNDVVSEFARLVGGLLGEGIALELKLAPDLPSIAADAGGLEQVLMNLALNARDAMPQGGVLRVATGVADVSAEQCLGHPGAHRGWHVCLTVADSGVGMDEQVLGHLFEPFFTTKEPGKGTGLGMMVVQSIVQQHNGFVEVESAVGKGATFRVFLPVEHAGAGGENALTPDLSPMNRVGEGRPAPGIRLP